MTVTDENGCSEYKNIFVPVHQLPEAEFTIDEVCSGFESVVNNLTQAGSGEIISWQWSFPESNLNSIDTTQDSIKDYFMIQNVIHY